MKTYRIPLYPGPEYLALPRPSTPWIIEGLLVHSGFLLVYSPSKQGKSYAMLQLSEAISSPQCPDFLSLQLHSHGTVGYLQLDTPPALWREDYVQALANSAGLGFENVQFQDRETCECYPFNIRQADHYDWLRAWSNDINPIAVVIDTYSAAFRGDQDDPDVVEQVIGRFQKAIAPAALILVHHSRKLPPDSAKDDEVILVDEPRGSTVLAAKADVLLRVSRKRWSITGRGGDMRLDILRDPDTDLLQLRIGDILAAVKIVMSNPSLLTDRARARELSSLTGLSESACRHRIQRAKVERK